MGQPVNARRAADAAWRMMDEEIEDRVRFGAALDLAHAALLAGDDVRFARAKRAVLRLALQEDYAGVAAWMETMSPEVEGRAMRRAS